MTGTDDVMGDAGTGPAGTARTCAETPPDDVVTADA